MSEPAPGGSRGRRKIVFVILVALSCACVPLVRHWIGSRALVAEQAKQIDQMIDVPGAAGAAQLRAFRAGYPTDFAGYRQAYLDDVGKGIPPRLAYANVAQRMATFSRRHLADLRGAPDEQLMNLMRVRLVTIQGLAAASPDYCARLLTKRLAPNERPPAATDPLVDKLAAAQMETMVAGRDRAARPAPAPEDLAALRRQMDRFGVTQADFDGTTSQLGVSTLAPERQCALEIASLRATLSLPAKQSARLAAAILSGEQ